MIGRVVDVFVEADEKTYRGKIAAYDRRKGYQIVYDDGDMVRECMLFLYSMCLLYAVSNNVIISNAHSHIYIRSRTIDDYFEGMDKASRSQCHVPFRQRE